MSGASTSTKAERFTVAMASARREFDLVSMDCDYFITRAKKLEAENAELRELCANMLHDAMENVCSKSYWCDKKNWQTCNDKSCGSYLYVEMARKLGIEA